MCNCTKKCSCNTISCPSIKSNSSDVTYNGGELSCSGLSNNLGLNEIIKGLDEALCEKTENLNLTTQLVNVGGEEQIYAGENNLGQKQIRTLEGDESLNVTTNGNVIEFGVDLDWLKQNGGTTIAPENIVEFNTVDPNSGSPTFNPNEPEDVDAVYWSNVNESVWKWNGTSYVTYDNPNLTPFYYAGTTNDVGGNKIARIYRTGAVGIGQANPAQMLDVNGTIRQSGATSELLKANADGDIIEAIAGTDYLSPTGDASLLTNFPTLNQNTTGNAATVTTNADLSGPVTSVGNVTSITNSGVIAGTYNNANITVGADGRITTASNGGGAKTLKDFTVDVQNDTNVLTSIFDYTMPANTMPTNGDKLTIYYAGKVDNTPISKTLAFYFGSNTIPIITDREDYFSIKIDVIRKSNTEVGISYLCTIGRFVDYLTVCENYPVTGLNAAQKIELTGEATNTGDITGVMGSIIYTPAAV